MKKILSMMLSISIFFSLFPITSYASPNSNTASVPQSILSFTPLPPSVTPTPSATTTPTIPAEFLHTYSDKYGGLIITNYYPGNEFFGHIEIPKTIEGQLVVGIKSGAFKHVNECFTMSIPSSIKYIQVGTFDDEHIQNIDVDKANQYFSSYQGILFNKTKTKLISYPNTKSDSEYQIAASVVTIGYKAFSNCSNLKKISSKTGLKTIGNYAFSSCSELVSFLIPTTVRSIGCGAFQSCLKLTAISIPAGVTSIKARTFSSCWALSKIRFPSGLYEIGDFAMSDCKKLSQITLASHITRIGSAAFQYCVSLNSVIFNKGVKTIGNKAFYHCDNLTYIDLYTSTISIGNEAFKFCKKLKAITFPTSLKSIGNSAFEECELLKKITIPSKVEKIGEIAFRHCNELKTINVSSNNKFYKSINGVLFNKSQTQLILYPVGKTYNFYEIPNRVKKLATCAFMNCTSLKRIWIPNGVERIEGYAFADTGFKTVVIPATMKFIAIGAFYSTELKEAYFLGNAPELETYIEHIQPFINKYPFKYGNNGTHLFYIDGKVGFSDPHNGQTFIPVDSIALSKSSITLKVGQNIKITPIILPANATNTDIYWRSSDSSIASTTSSSGIIKAKKTGEAVITLYSVYGNAKIKLKVKIIKN
ncbi:MAG: leucine-rich repeat protein [Clostridia bacterium]|jgi:uncharacterized protein YjdB